MRLTFPPAIGFLRRALAAALAATALTSLCCGSARADSVSTRALQVSELASGVYSIRHPDPTDDFPDGNTTVIVGSRAVLVIDTCYLPSSARADIARIRAWTDRPVRWVLNTHWHNDHVGGNAEYLRAWPGAEIIGHEETRTMMQARVSSYLRRFTAEDSVFARQREALRRQVESGRDEQGAALAPAQREAAAASLRRYEAARAEFQTLQLQPPTLSFDRELRLDLGGRIVEIQHLGRGNTGGDLVAWLPAERILVAGDLVDHPVPYAFGGYPREWIQTLERLAALDIAQIVPGHGQVLQGKAYLERVLGLLRQLRQRVDELMAQHGSGLTLQDLRKAIELGSLRREWAGEDADNQAFFDASIGSLLRLLHNEARAR